MSWTNVRLIFLREVRDQLRDRRTLFMIAVLPLLLYPLLGMSLLQVTQFVREQPTRIVLLGADDLPVDLPLVVDGGLSPQWFETPAQARLLKIERDPGGPATDAHARELLADGTCEAVVVFPPSFAAQLAALAASVAERAGVGPTPVPIAADASNDARNESLLPAPEVYFNSAQEKSQLTAVRARQALAAWRTAWGGRVLQGAGLPASAARPFEIADRDTAEASRRQAAAWSKLLPFLLLIWALTGAFYPAIDLCAGEKERGTLETLLCSPAQRSEIVWGKLLTVMTFSIATSLLNLTSLGLTTGFLTRQLGAAGLDLELGPPPAWAALWLLVALVPMASLFSALCLALAALARSTKEGQYYLMPLLLVTMPLVVLPMSPSVELTLGSSLIPVTGVVLLLRALLEGDYLRALPFVPPVVCVTGACCLLATRWAIDQFNSESVLFREGERLDLGHWLARLLRDRDETPSAPEAFLCGLLILLVNFFLTLSLASRELTLVESALVSQLAGILAPALLMTVMLTRSPRKTLLLRAPPWQAVAGALALAICVHPLALALVQMVSWLYPLPPEVAEKLQHLMGEPPLWQLLLVVAILPPICEELAFRGFILSGFRHLGRRGRAVLLSSIFFGLAHSILQQSLVAAIWGLVLGFLAVQSGSIWPSLCFHLVHNGLLVFHARLGAGLRSSAPWLFDAAGEGYARPVVVLAGLCTLATLWWLNRLPSESTPEETLQEALSHQESPSAPDVPA